MPVAEAGATADYSFSTPWVLFLTAHTEEIAARLRPLSDLQIFVASVALLLAALAAFLVVAGARTGKLLDAEPLAARKRAWVVTLMASLVCSVVGVYYALKMVSAGYQQNAKVVPRRLDHIDWPFSEADTVIAHALCLFFVAYCAVDSVCAATVYQDQVSIGFRQHAGYGLLIGYLLASGHEIFFALGAVEMVPTLIKSIFETRGDARPRLSVGLSIFVFRISWHLYATYVSIARHNAWLYLLSSSLLMEHVTWFRAWFFSRVSRVRAQDDEKAAGLTPAATTKRLKLQVETHVYLVSLLFLLQAAFHAAVVLAEVSDYLLPRADWTERSYALAWLLLELLAHTVTFGMVTLRMAKILEDIYSEHFIMHSITQRSVIYNISWEDPRVERELLGIGPEDVILTISSAGCNVLDYLCNGPKAIVACDLNAAQLAVLELKLACIKTLSHADFFAIWAESDVAVFERHYAPTLRPILSASAASFWDENEGLLRDNFMFAGTSGLAAKLLQPGIRFLGLDRYMALRRSYPPASVLLAVIRQVLAAPWVWAWFAPLGGVPRAQLDLIKREPQVWADRLEEVVGRRMWAKDNYFYYAYVCGRWTRECCPRYLEERHFATLKAHADRVSVFHGPIAEAAATRDDFTVASLLDSMDWMPDSMIASQLAALLPHMDRAKGHLFWRTFATKVHSPVLAALRPEHVPDDDGAERVGWYLSQWVAKVPSLAPASAPVPGVLTRSGSWFGTAAPAAAAAPDFAALALEGGGRPVKANSFLDDVSVMVQMGLQALRSDKDVTAFYKSQGANYDGFREALLPGRDTLLKHCLPWAARPKTWLSIGCGTARDIEYVVEHVKRSGTRVYLLDLSPELLAMARARVDELSIAHLVTCVVADVTSAWGADGAPTGELADRLPHLGTVDVVTCSYCLTMIPPWRDAFEVMVAALAPGGVIAIVDFTVRTDRPDHWSQRLNKWWFAMDGVFFDVEHTRVARSHPKLKTFWFREAEARVPYTPLEATHYTWAATRVA